MVFGPPVAGHWLEQEITHSWLYHWALPFPLSPKSKNHAMFSKPVCREILEKHIKSLHMVIVNTAGIEIPVKTHTLNLCKCPPLIMQAYITRDGNGVQLNCKY